VDRATGQAVVAGQRIRRAAGKAPQGVDVIHPLRDGVIADLDAAIAMLQAFLRQARLRRGLLRPAAVVCVPSGATFVERRALAAAVEAGRPRCTVQLVDEPVAAAAGAGFGLTGGAGAFIVDVGGGTTEVAAVAGGHLVRAESLARRLKMALGLTGGTDEWAEAVGVDVVQGTPRAERIPGELVATALEPCIHTIIEAVREILLNLPPDLAEDVALGKICLAGGGALLPGLAGRIETVAGIPALVVDDPLRCVVRGAAEIVETGGRAAPGVVRAQP